MTAPTHIAAAELLYLVLLTTTGVLLSPVNAALVALSSVLPDADTGASYVGRALPPVSRLIEARFGHRTLTHSFLFCLLLAVMALPLSFVSRDVYYCLLLGYSSHPVLDTMTVNGVRLFYPFSNAKCVFPLEVNNPSRYRTQTGSSVDRTIGILLALACLPAFLVANQGYERFIRYTQKTIESAVRDYNEFSRARLVFAEILAHSLLTKQTISGRVELSGALNDHTLLFKDSTGQLHSLGKEYQAEYVAESVVCFPGDSVRTIVRTIDMSNQPMATVERYLDPRWESQLFGVLKTRDPITLPEDARPFASITCNGSSLKLHYADVEEIMLQKLENVFIEKGILTVRTILPATEPSDVRNPSDSANVNYMPLTLSARSGVTMRQLVAPGARVDSGQVLAVASDPRRSSLRSRRAQVLSWSEASMIRNIDNQIASAKVKVEQDSLACELQRRLIAQGFGSSGQLEKPEASVESSRMKLESLIRRKDLVLRRSALRKDQWLADSLRAVELDRAARLTGELRSPTHGAVIDVRRLERGGRIHLTFIIRRDGP